MATNIAVCLAEAGARVGDRRRHP
ncbi:MAG: hypothetical protein U0521_25970 [Anaerolineae bacterium]